MNDDSTHTQTAPKTHSEIEKAHAHKIATGAVEAVRKSFGLDADIVTLDKDALVRSLGLSPTKDEIDAELVRAQHILPPTPEALKSVEGFLVYVKGSRLNPTRSVDALMKGGPGTPFWVSTDEPEIAATCDRVYKAVVYAILA